MGLRRGPPLGLVSFIGNAAISHEVNLSGKSVQRECWGVFGDKEASRYAKDANDSQIINFVLHLLAWKMGRWLPKWVVTEVDKTPEWLINKHASFSSKLPAYLGD